MSHRRRAVPAIDRHSTNSHTITFFDILIPPGVSQDHVHPYLEAHLGAELARKVEQDNDGAGTSE